jgi:hypothetical protein
LYLVGVVTLLILIALLARYESKWNILRMPSGAIMSFLNPDVFERMSLLATVLVISLFFAPNSWLAAENIQMSDRPKTTAFVVSTDAQFTTLISVDKIRAQIVPTDSIKSRIPCSLTSSVTP